MEKNEICIIRSKLKKDYVYDALKHYGYYVMTPYGGNSLFFRIIREIWFRCHLPFRRIWFKKPYNKYDYKVIIVFDPLIMPDYLGWIHENNPSARMILYYENRADMTIRPDSVPSYVEKSSYDIDDCEKYSMKWRAPSFFTEYIRVPNKNPRFDVLYVGRDKGRAMKLLELEKKLKDMGYKTYFHICGDRKFLRFKKRFYKRLLTYDEYMDLMIDSRAILNIVPEGQTCITQREMEAFFSGIKCITNNKGVLTSDMYNPSQFFVLGHDSFEEFDSFMKKAVRPASNEVVQKYDFDRNLGILLQSDNRN